MRHLHRTLATSLLAVCATQPSWAAERFWSDPRGGFFSDESNWDDGVSGVPEETDTTVFDLDAEYEVTFVLSGGAVTDRAIVRHGSVAFFDLNLSELDESYALLNRVSLTPGLVVGEADGDDPSLALIAHVDLRTAFTTLGQEAGAFGTINAQESSYFEVAEHLRIGDRGLGELTITEQAELLCNVVGIGHGAGSFGAATVSGSEAEWTIDGPLAVGRGGTGSLLVEDRADLSSGDTTIGQQEGSDGAVIVRGSGSSWFVFGTLDVGMNGLGALTIEDGASVFNFTFATIGTFPKGFIAGGEEAGRGVVTVDGPTSTWFVQGDLYVGLFGDGELVLARGGRTQVDGDLLTFSDGRLTIELSDSAEYTLPALSVGGSADGSDLTLTLSLVDGFVPEAGDRFHVIAAAGDLEPFTITVPDLPAPLRWITGQDEHDIIMTVGTGDIDGDGVVDFGDLIIVVMTWGDCPDPPAPCPADLDGSGDVDFDDLLIVLTNWG